MSKSIPEVRGAPSVTASAFWTDARRREGIVWALCILAALLVTLLHSPAFMPYVWPDSGTFQYVGHRLLEGQVLYVDVWDQKPPLIYYLNALGVWLGGGGRWGVWFLSFCAVGSAIVLSVKLLRRGFGLALALLVTSLWLLAYFQLIDDGNMTEEFALPLQFGALWLAWQVETKRTGEYGWRGFWIGVLVGAIFFLKSNMIGVGLAIGLYVLIHAWSKRDARYAVRQLAPMLGGALLVAGIALGVLWAQGALDEFFEIVFQYNVIYVGRFGLIEGTLAALRAGFTALGMTGLIVYGGLGFAVGVACLLWARNRISPKLVPLFGICALALPLEIVLVTTTRREFGHYYVALFYVLAVWSAWLLWLVRSALFELGAPTTARTRMLLTFGLACGVGFLALPAVDFDIRFAVELRKLEPPEVVNYMREHTNPEDTVLIPGYEPRLLLFADRRAPTRYVHTIPFEFAAFATPARVESYFDDVLKNKPKLIVDPRGYGLENFTPAVSARLRKQIKQLQRQYEPVGPIAGWQVYALR